MGLYSGYIVTEILNKNSVEFISIFLTNACVYLFGWPGMQHHMCDWWDSWNHVWLSRFQTWPNSTNSISDAYGRIIFIAATTQVSGPLLMGLSQLWACIGSVRNRWGLKKILHFVRHQQWVEMSAPVRGIWFRAASTCTEWGPSLIIESLSVSMCFASNSFCCVYNQ